MDGDCAVVAGKSGGARCDVRLSSVLEREVQAVMESMMESSQVRRRQLGTCALKAAGDGLNGHAAVEVAERRGRRRGW